jgi:hypothetical protein
MRWGIPITSPSRTLLDLAMVLTERDLRDAVRGAGRLRLLDPMALAGMAGSSRGRRGTRRLLEILAAYRPLPDTRSTLQGRFLEVLDEAGLPRPAVDVVVDGLEVDCLWPRERLVVELDGYGFHSDPAAFEADRRRDVRLQLAGYVVLRFTHKRVVGAPGEMVAEVATALAREQVAGR